ncbi:MAG: alginate lyase family protein [Cyclobacteriaceae bacterium]
MKSIQVIFTTILLLNLTLLSCNEKPEFDLVEIERERVLSKAEKYLDAEPITVTADTCERSAGGIHDFYSEGDYWWPNPEDPDGPYIRKDGMTNPENFTRHREVMIRLSQVIGALTSAYIVTLDAKYVEALVPHLKAWFVNEETRMNPNLLYAQAIMGRVTGRGIGIIDTIHLMEVAQAVYVLEKMEALNSGDFQSIKSWFSDYLNWITTHDYGEAERDNGNNHSTCWAMQAATFARLAGNEEVMNYCRNMYKEVLLPEQMANDGGFPKELGRTKPYGYSLFNLDAMTMVCLILDNEKENLFKHNTADGRGMELALEFMYPYVKHKSSWPYDPDVMYWDEWPVRHPSLLFGGLKLERSEYLQTWKNLEANFTTPEIVRNVPIRYPLLWLDRP